MKQIVKSFVGICSILIIAELTLRQLAKTSQNIRFFTTNPYQQTYFAENTGWKGITAVACSQFLQYPGAELNGFLLNSHGFASPEYPYAKPNGTKRIVFLGDSQTMGEVPYPNSFVRVTESRFAQENKNIQAINLAAICIGPGMEKQILIHEGVQFQPDVVVLGFFVGNDFEDDKDILATYNAHKKTTHLLPFWVYQSRLYSLIRTMRLYLIYGRTSPLLKKTDTKKTGIDTKHYTFDPTRATLSTRDYFALEEKRTFLFDRTSYVYGVLDTVLQHVLDIKLLSEKAGAKFLVIIIPDELQVSKALQEQVNKKTPIDPATISLPQTILKEMFDTQDISYIDLLPQWESSPAAQTYYLPRNTHLNIEGNQAIADTLYPELQKLLQ